MKVIRQLLFAWMLIAFLVLQGFGQDAKPPPPPPPKPLPLPTKIITKSVSDENSSGNDDKLKLTTIKQRRTIKIPPRKPVPVLDWSDFIYNSPEEKAFWDELPDWGTGWTSTRSLSSYKRNAQGQTIESNSSEGFNGYVKHKWGSIRTIYQFVDGYAVREKSWYSNGQKSGESKYKDGKLDGLSTWWHENGQKSSETNYKDGKLNGLWTWWYENGQKEQEENHKDGGIIGTQTRWYESGEKEWERNFKNKIMYGQTYWYENGQKKREDNWKDAKLIHAKVWLPDGKECPESKVIDGNGTLVTYSLEGKEIGRLNFKDGIRRYKNPIPGRIPKRPLVLSEANSTTRPRYMPPRLKTPPKLPDWLKRNKSVRPLPAPIRRNPRPIPKRPASSEANSSKSLTPPPKILPPAPPPPPPVPK